MRSARASRSNDPVGGPSAEVVALRGAFAELHGRSLHGFALLLLLGDAVTARELATASLAAGLDNVLALRHPERAAAWLRADLLRVARRRHLRQTAARDSHALAALGVTPAVADALAGLDLEQRAVVIAADVEGLDPRDVDAIVRRDRDRGARFLARARRRYLAAFTGAPSGAGPVSRRIAAVAESVGHFGGR